MSKKVVIIGGGIMGVCSAYFLNKEGHEVTIIDKSNFSSGASFVNAGYITPVSGGVGPMTVATLLENTLLAQKLT